MNATLLLAKSLTPGREPLSLATHCQDTEQAACGIFRETGRWSQAWARFFRLDAEGRDRFLLNLRVAALFHDIGKANEEFQALMSRQARGPGPQTLRHEHISALVLSLPEVRTWLDSNPALDVDVITAAVLSHHFKASDQGKWRWGHPHTTQPRLRLQLDHPEVRALFERVRQIAQLGAMPELPAAAWSLSGAWSDAQERGRRNAIQLGRAIRRQNDPRVALLLAVKAGVIVADTVASGLFRVGGSMDQWIEEVVHMDVLSGDDIAEKIIDPRINQIAQRSGTPFKLHRFQELAAEQGRRALLLAGCGAGKTLAAWRWAESRARAEPIGRVIFLYPTRGTATEGFRDYVGWAPQGEAALLHGTATYELEAMRENPPESMQGKERDPGEDQARLYALEHWPRRFFSATVDQFLGFMEHNYTGTCLLPTLADSAVIFDEVHSYDRRMFKTLRAFLERFDVPVLCMTATLPPDRRAALAECGLVTFPGEQHRAELEDLEAQECRPRYRVRPVDTVARALEQAVDAYRSGQRVLWVVNTVRQCLSVADLLAEQLGHDPLTYHSRFRLCDRKIAHERTIAAFRPDAGPALAVTTQVCEMSLDLDADMLITEVAPVTSLVQRFGRSNRSPSRPSGDRSTVLWYPPERHRPYTAEELLSGANMLQELGAAEVSQRLLSEALERHAPPGPPARSHAPFLSGGYYAVPGSLREDQDYTRLAVLDSDLDELLQLKRERAPYDGLLVPVPKRDILDPETRPRELPRHLEIAPSNRYSSTRGFGVENGG